VHVRLQLKLNCECWTDPRKIDSCVQKSDSRDVTESNAWSL